MGKKANSLFNVIGSSPFRPKAKFGLIKRIRNASYILRLKENQACLVMSNEAYWLEYWLKQYCDYRHDIYAQIEHGVYFGKTLQSEVDVIHGLKEFDSIITYGEYRRSCIQETYPECHVETIGPYIQYVETDEIYLQEIKSKVSPSLKTLVLFPMHSMVTVKTQVNYERLIDECLRYATERDYGNLVVCLSPNDYNPGLIERFERKGFIVVTSGKDSRAFLSRQRAIYEIADVTVSNNWGTHIGYSLAMGKPHRLIDVVSTEDEIAWGYLDAGANVDLLKSEKESFIEAFALDDSGMTITPEQKELYTYYWGGGTHKTPSEMADLLYRCEEHYCSLYKR